MDNRNERPRTAPPVRMRRGGHQGTRAEDSSASGSFRSWNGGFAGSVIRDRRWNAAIAASIAACAAVFAPLMVFHNTEEPGFLHGWNLLKLIRAVMSLSGIRADGNSALQKAAGELKDSLLPVCIAAGILLVVNLASVVIMLGKSNGRNIVMALLSCVSDLALWRIIRSAAVKRQAEFEQVFSWASGQPEQESILQVRGYTKAGAGLGCLVLVITALIMAVLALHFYRRRKAGRAM